MRDTSPARLTPLADAPWITLVKLVESDPLPITNSFIVHHSDFSDKILTANDKAGFSAISSFSKHAWKSGEKQKKNVKYLIHSTASKL